MRFVLPAELDNDIGLDFEPASAPPGSRRAAGRRSRLERKANGCDAMARAATATPNPGNGAAPTEDGLAAQLMGMAALGRANRRSRRPLAKRKFKIAL
jgi:hypothetical protein